MFIPRGFLYHWKEFSYEYKKTVCSVIRANGYVIAYFQFFNLYIVKLDLLQTMYIYSLFPYPAVHHIVFQYRFHLKSVTKYATIIIQKEQPFHEMVDLRMSLKSTSSDQSMRWVSLCTTD